MSESGEIQSFGRYLVTEKVGEGAMADVYAAHDPEIDRKVAIKVLKDELCVDEDYVARFLREARAAGTITHPNIVTIFDVGRVDDKPYITMEFLDEQTLGDILERGERLPVKRLLSIGIQLAKALDYAHRQGVVHRDVKPQNILFLRDSETIKVADFGIAHMGKGEEGEKSGDGTVLGTPHYMSPEQATGGEVDGRSDLFSAGVILYELATGHKAFDAGTLTTLLMQITKQDPVPLRKVAPDLPIGLQRIISKLLNKRPERRYQTGAELALALQREFDAVIDQEQEASRNRFVPLKIKWAFGAGAAVGMVMLFCVMFVFYKQGEAIERQALDSGASLAKFIATDAAVPVLSADWSVLEIDVKNASARDTFVYLTIADHKGIVRAATDTNLVGKTFKPPANAEVIRREKDFTASIVTEANRPPVFAFDTPILFLYQGQPKKIGDVHLAVSREGLDRVMQKTRVLLLGLGAITVISVIGMLYVFGGLLARPFRRLREAMVGLGAGDLDVRISDTRNDEIGEVFTAFNRMAEALQRGGAAESPGDEGEAAALPADIGDGPVDDATIVARTREIPEVEDGDAPPPDATVISIPRKRDER
ncbi:MAG: protein kinase [Alphaproteobacteria bacterium]|nr:protein kinase [Alphaproteobacteria bacterium]